MLSSSLCAAKKPAPEASVDDDGEDCVGQSARRFQGHQYSCFGLYPSCRANFSTLNPIRSYHSTRLAHSALVAVASSFVAFWTGNRRRPDGHDGVGRVVALQKLQGKLEAVND